MEDVRRIGNGLVEPSPADVFDKVVEILRDCCVIDEHDSQFENILESDRNEFMGAKTLVTLLSLQNKN